MKAAFIRGLPGSGKSTYADKIINARSAEGRHTFHYESDMFFTSDSGVYTFNASLLLQAHNWCFDKFCEALSIGSPSDMVIISNTFIRRKPGVHGVRLVTVNWSARGHCKRRNTELRKVVLDHLRRVPVLFLADCFRC